MSNLIVPNAGELVLQNTLLKTALLSDQALLLKLFQNNYTPVDSTVTADFTEANFTSYTSKSLARATWNDATTVSGAAVSTYGSSPQTWTCGTTGNTIYGYYIVGATDNITRWAQRFDNPIVLTNGLTLGVTPTFSGYSQF